MHPVYKLSGQHVSAETADMFYEKTCLLAFLVSLLHDKRKGELAGDDDFKDFLEVCSVTQDTNYAYEASQ